MDWRVMLTTFGVIFLAEMGDKTQIAAMNMAAKETALGSFHRRVAGAGRVSAIGVIVGSLLSQYFTA